MKRGARTHSLPLLQLNTPNPMLCALEQVDYQECLHRDKLKRRIAAKALEVTRQGSAGAAGAAAGGGGGHH